MAHSQKSDFKSAQGTFVPSDIQDAVRIFLDPLSAVMFALSSTENLQSFLKFMGCSKPDLFLLIECELIKAQLGKTNAASTAVDNESFAEIRRREKKDDENWPLTKTVKGIFKRSIAAMGIGAPIYGCGAYLYQNIYLPLQQTTDSWHHQLETPSCPWLEGFSCNYNLPGFSCNPVICGEFQTAYSASDSAQGKAIWFLIGGGVLTVASGIALICKMPSFEVEVKKTAFESNESFLSEHAYNLVHITFKDKSFLEKADISDILKVLNMAKQKLEKRQGKLTESLGFNPSDPFFLGSIYAIKEAFRIVKEAKRDKNKADSKRSATEHDTTEHDADEKADATANNLSPTATPSSRSSVASPSSVVIDISDRAPPGVELTVVTVPSLAQFSVFSHSGASASVEQHALTAEQNAAEHPTERSTPPPSDTAPAVSSSSHQEEAASSEIPTNTVSSPNSSRP